MDFTQVKKPEEGKKKKDENPKVKKRRKKKVEGEEEEESHPSGGGHGDAHGHGMDRKNVQRIHFGKYIMNTWYYR